MTQNPPQNGITIDRTPLAIQHIRITTPRPYPDVKQALESRLGRLDDKIRELLRQDRIDEVRAALQRAAGEDGLAIHYIGPHGDWLALQGQRQRATAYLIGNVLYAVQMTGVRLAAGLYAPLRVVLYENAAGGSTFEYDLPSSQFGQFGEPEIDRIAAELDRRLEALLRKVGTP
ncbi:DUF302 domain-containing protein [Pseudorhodoferax sp.]|uniref:DUF302 domain-containing protein n=1 Tax=Pseudorhodoferax sp. TaxID=1993553 RepID=UPI002DD62275|nr:DUF302 domain-containing protein [Pseudorhodoferax sp.]